MGADQVAFSANRPRTGPSMRSQRGLDWLNFLIADVETAFGPFVSVYLSQHGWAQGDIGTVITINSGVAWRRRHRPGRWWTGCGASAW
jgi:hypothetical protein